MPVSPALSPPRLPPLLTLSPSSPPATTLSTPPPPPFTPPPPQEPNEPEIYHAIKFGTILENVVFDEETRHVDFDSK